MTAGEFRRRKGRRRKMEGRSWRAENQKVDGQGNVGETKQTEGGTKIWIEKKLVESSHTLVQGSDISNVSRVDRF